MIPDGGAGGPPGGGGAPRTEHAGGGGGGGGANGEVRTTKPIGGAEGGGGSIGVDCTACDGSDAGGGGCGVTYCFINTCVCDDGSDRCGTNGGACVGTTGCSCISFFRSVGSCTGGPLLPTLFKRVVAGDEMAHLLTGLDNFRPLFTLILGATVLDKGGTEFFGLFFTGFDTIDGFF